MLCFKINENHTFDKQIITQKIAEWNNRKRSILGLQMTQIGQYLYDNLQNVTNHYPYTEIPLFVVMPDHWHAIVYIDANKIPYIRRDGACPVLKTSVTKFANTNNIDFAWQIRFHEHIIREQEEMNRFANYIENNINKKLKELF